MTVFKLPDLGEGLSEAEVLRWHVQVGDRVEVDAPMLAVETAKAVVEVPSPVAGTITALHAQPGDRIEIGAALVEFALEAGTEAADSGTVVGYMPAAADDYPGSEALPAVSPVTAPRARAVPAARALARSLGVNLAAVSGSGQGGLITIEDVLARAGPSARGGVAALQPPADFGAQVQELRGPRRAMAQSMTSARDSVAACTVFDDADLHRWRPGADYSARVLRAIAVAVRAEPGLNAWYDATHERRLLFTRVDVGLAVDTPDGLIVPVIRRVETLSASQLRAELDRLKRAARDRSLSSEEMRHSTFVLSNFGTLAGRYATPVVLPPTVAILGTGRARQDVLAVDGQPQPRWRMPLSLSFDHRVVTGGEAVRFLGALIGDLELPE
jgi:pyruvate dehydrogenase E2 component (dihydrolipoamide acetyltransferase)